MGKINIKNVKRSRLLSDLIDNKNKIESERNDIILLKRDAIKKQEFQIAAQLRDKEKSLDREIDSINFDICNLKGDG